LFHYVRKIPRSTPDDLFEPPFCSDPTCTDAASIELYQSKETILKECGNDFEECHLTDFVLEKSASNAPVGSSIDQIKSFAENNSVSLPSDWNSTWRETIQKNYVGITIVGRSQFVTNNRQKSALTFIDLLSNVGGHSGLWIGVSFLSIMEVIEMVYRLIRLQVQRIMRR
jgi:hypothetical protein